MNKTYKTILAAAALSCGLAGYAVSGVIIAEERWDTPGDTSSFALANEVGASGAALAVPGAFGSPAPAMNVTADTSGDFGVNIDTISTTGGAGAQFLGQYNAEKPESVGFDFYQDAEPAGLQLYFIANGITWYYDIDTSGFANSAWNISNVGMASDSGWTDLGASGDDFLTDLGAGVTEIGFRLTYLTNTAGQNYGFDNLTRNYRTPEPETYAALSFALICLGITFRRRLQAGVNGALATLKS